MISIAELCKTSDLPGDFLSEVSHTAAGGKKRRPDSTTAECVTRRVCVCFRVRSCPNGWGGSSRERWTPTTGGSSSRRLSSPGTKPGYAASSAPSRGERPGVGVASRALCQELTVCVFDPPNLQTDARQQHDRSLRLPGTSPLLYGDASARELIFTDAYKFYLTVKQEMRL